MKTAYYMNEKTGSVDTEENWLAEGASLSDLTRVVSASGKYPKIFNPAKHSASIEWIEPHGNTDKRNAAKPVQKQSLTIRLPPEIRNKALAQSESASVYIEKLIRADKA
jgi:hypothetical protein